MSKLNDHDSKNTPVVYFAFNRPDLTSRSWASICRWKPNNLYIITDGPRKNHKQDNILCNQVREILKKISWECKVTRIYSQHNLGCRLRVASGLDKVFEENESAIIIEDDCVVNDDFFIFCSKLLDTYSQNENIFGISGTNHLTAGHMNGDFSYFFTKYASSWGWATWRRVWFQSDLSMSFWPRWRLTSSWRSSFSDSWERLYWTVLFDDCYYKRIDSWALPFLANQWYREGVFLMSRANLVSNIGFGSDSTHTSNQNSPQANKPIAAVGSLNHPSEVFLDEEVESLIFNKNYGGEKFKFPYIMAYLPRLYLGKIYRYLRSLS